VDDEDVSALVLALMALLVATLPLGWALWILRVECRRDRVPILCYHRFLPRSRAGTDADREMGWVCYDDEFERQMEYLAANGWTTLDLDDYVDIREGRTPAPARGIIVTMDDGYRSNYELAYPVLKRLGMKAVVYVALEPDLHTRRQVEGIDGFLSADQLRSLDADGVSIQSHTLTHSILTELSDEDVRFELSESKKRLEEILGRPVDHFCFPRGGVDRRVRKLAIEAGYQTASGANQGTATALDAAHDLPRIMMERDMGLAEFRRVLTPLHGALTRIMGRLKGISRRLLGARGARRLRDLLHRDFLLPLWRARALRGLIATGLGLYLVGAVFVARTVFSD